MVISWRSEVRGGCPKDYNVVAHMGGVFSFTYLLCLNYLLQGKNQKE